MSDWLGSQSKIWTLGKLKHSPNGVKSTVFLSHLSSVSLYTLCLSHLTTCSLSHLSSTSLSLSSQRLAQPFLCSPSPSWVSSLPHSFFQQTTQPSSKNPATKNIPQHRQNHKLNFTNKKKNHKIKKNHFRNCFQP